MSSLPPVPKNEEVVNEPITATIESNDNQVPLLTSIDSPSRQNTLKINPQDSTFATKFKVQISPTDQNVIKETAFGNDQ